MSAPDPKFGLASPGLTASATRVFAITPGTGALSVRTRALYVGGDGNVVIVDAVGNEAVFVGVMAGTILPVRVDKVLATATALGSPAPTTTASAILGLY